MAETRQLVLLGDMLRMFSKSVGVAGAVPGEQDEELGSVRVHKPGSGLELSRSAIEKYAV